VDCVVAAGDIDLAVREFGGTGNPVLLLHGAGNNLADMAPLARCLTDDHRVVGMDFRDHGRSGDGPWTWEAVLDDIRAVLEKLGMTSPLLVGHSLGGMVAAMYSHRRGGVAGAVNLDGFGAGTPSQYDMDPAEVIVLLQQLRAVSDDTIESLTKPQTGEQVTAARQAWVEGAASLGIEAALAHESFERPLVAGPDGTFTRRPIAERLAEMRSCLEELDVLDLYSHTTAPQLVCVAVRDEPDPDRPSALRPLFAARTRGVTAQLRLIAQARPNVHVVELDATHGLIYEHPQLIADRIREFEAQLASGRTDISGRTLAAVSVASPSDGEQP
jgi:pimeloyl-ACP methyl ester carboxylesterase